MISAEKATSSGSGWEEEEDDVPIVGEEIIDVELVGAEKDLIERARCCVIVLDRSSKPFGDSIIESLEMRKISTVCDVLTRKVYGNLYFANEVVVAEMIPHGQNLRIPKLSSLIVGNDKNKIVLMLGSFGIANHVSSAAKEGNLRKVTTSSVQAAWAASLQASLQNVEQLGIGNIISGTPAAFINHCEARNIPCCAIFTMVHAAISPIAAKSFETLLPLVREFVGCSSLSPLDPSKYKKMMRSDPFLSATESLYS